MSDAPAVLPPEGHGPAGTLVGAPLAATIRRVAIPAVVANLLMTAFHNIDTIWIGRYLGAEALAASTSSVFWIWIVISVGEMVSIGLDAVAARRHGERRPAEAARTAGDGVLLAIGLGTVIALAVPFVIDTLFAIMGSSPSITAIGRRYLGTLLLGTPLIFGYFAIDATFRAYGDTRTPLFVLAATTVLGLVLDPILILGAGPIPAMGVLGAACATVVPRGLACLVGLHLLRKRGLISFQRPRVAVLASIARIGGPAAATGVIFSLIYVLLTRTTSQFGTPALAALGLGFRVESVVYVVSVGFGAAVAAIVGQSMGAGQIDRARRAGWIAMGIVSVFGGVMALVVSLVPETIASAFSTDPAVVAEAGRYLRIAAFAQLFLGAEVVLESAMGGAGYSLPPMLASTAITALRIPVGAWSAVQFGTTGLWWTLAVTAAARGIAMALLWWSGRWRRTLV